VTDDPRSPLDALARAVAAAEVVDWDRAEESASDETTRRLVRELRVVAAVSDVHRRTREAGAPPATDGPLAGGPHPAWRGLALLERIAHGSYGDVYRAWDPRVDREVALKLLQAPAPAGAEPEHTIEEARRLARVRHPNIVTVYGADRDDARVGLWMEFIRGRTLDAIVGAGGPVPATEAARIGIDVCRALAAVHAAGLVHRDVKAQNVMVEDGGRVVLMDFGASIESGESSTHGLAGTPLYLAPEVLAGEPGTGRSDIYSVGVLLYYLATGSYPVGGRDIAEVREAHRRHQRMSLLDAHADVPRGFAKVVDRALAADPADRFAGAAAVEAALATWLASANGDLAPGPRRSSRRLAARAAWAALSLAAILLAFDVGGLRSRVVGGLPPAPGAAAPPATSLELRQLDLPQVMHWGAPSPDGRHLPAVDLKGNLALVDERVHGQGAPLQQLTAINFAAQSRCEQSVRDSASRELFLDDSVGEIRPDFDPRVLTIWFACQAVGRREGSANHRLSAQLQPVPISPDAPGGACV
jgi:serine/threonine-protein kinase